MRDHARNVIGLNAFRAQVEHAVDVRVDHGAAGERLESDAVDHVARPKAIEQFAVIGLLVRCESLEESVRAFENGKRPGKSGLRQKRGADAQLRGPAG